MFSIHRLFSDNQGPVVFQNSSKNNSERLVCSDQTRKKVELVLANNGNLSVYFQENLVEHNFPKEIRDIERVKIFLKNVWIQSIKYSDGEIRISFNPTLRGGGLLEDRLTPQKLAEIKERCERAPKNPVKDIVGELLAEDIVEIHEMDVFISAITHLYECIKEKDDVKVDDDNKEREADVEIPPREPINYALTVIDQDAVQYLPPAYQPMAEQQIQRKLDKGSLVVRSGSEKLHTALSTALERVEENSCYIQVANQQQQSSAVVLQQFSEQVEDLKAYQQQKLVESEGLTRAVVHQLSIQASMRNELAANSGSDASRQMTLLERSKLSVVMARNDAEAMGVQFEAMRIATEKQSQMLITKAEAFARANDVVIAQYEKAAKAVLEQTCKRVSELRSAELKAFMAEQSGRQNIKEEEYRIDLAKRAKVDELNREEKDFFLQMKEKESKIVLDEKLKANEIDLAHQLKMNQQEQARMEKELAYLKEKDGDIVQRNLMIEFDAQLKAYERDVDQCRKEVQLCGGKKNYRLSLKPPEIKTGHDGKKYIQPGQASYHIY